MASKREERLHAAIGEALPALADVTALLRGPNGIDRDELADELSRVASVLIRARNATDEPQRGGRGRAYLRARCRTCGHARRFHSPHVDPAEPCTHGEETGEPCDCTRFVA